MHFGHKTSRPGERKDFYGHLLTVPGRRQAMEKILPSKSHWIRRVYFLNCFTTPQEGNTVANVGQDELAKRRTTVINFLGPDDYGRICKLLPP